MTKQQVPEVVELVTRGTCGYVSTQQLNILVTKWYLEMYFNKK